MVYTNNITFKVLAVCIIFALSQLIKAEPITISGVVGANDSQWQQLANLKNVNELSDVTFVDGMKLVLSNESLVLRVKQLKILGTATITTFPDTAQILDGANGNDADKNGKNGGDGLAAGTLTIEADELIGDSLHVQLMGQNGGRGGDGFKGNDGAHGGDFKNCDRVKTKQVEEQEPYATTCPKTCKRTICAYNCTECDQYRFFSVSTQTTIAMGSPPPSPCREETYDCSEPCVQSRTIVKDYNYTVAEPCEQAQSGSDGSPGGNAGNGGLGGTGGSFILRIKDKFDIKLAVNVKGGIGGNAGTPGTGGAGGTPGTASSELGGSPTAGATGATGQIGIDRQQQFGKPGHFTFTALSNLLQQRLCLTHEIMKLKRNKDSLIPPDIKTQHYWVDFHWQHQFEDPYNQFNPELHASTNPEVTEEAFQKLLDSRIDGYSLSDTEQQFLQNIRSHYIALLQNESAYKSIKIAIATFQKSIQQQEQALQEAGKWNKGTIIIDSANGIDKTVPDIVKEKIRHWITTPGESMLLQHNEVFPEYAKWQGDTFNSLLDNEQDMKCQAF